MMRRARQRVCSPVSESLSSTTTTTEPSTYVARRTNVRGRRGGLQSMPGMPLDILLELFTYFYPADLLNLARTTKAFRAFLMSRTSASYWRAARQNVEGLPPCPEHLSEPAYANLLFFPHCHNCLKPNVRNVLWRLSVRYCSNCMKIRLPSSADEETACTEEVKKHAMQCAEWYTKKQQVRSDELTERRRARLHDIIERLSDLGYREECNHIMHRWQYYEGIRDSRFNPFPLWKFLQPAVPLTERVWAKLRDSAVEVMEEYKAQRLAQEQLNLVKAKFTFLREAVDKFHLRKLKTSESEYLPTPHDFSNMPEIKAALRAPDCTPDEFKEKLTELTATFPDLTVRWKADMEARFTAIAVDAGFREDIQPLTLAAAVFSCCKTDQHYPNILAHKCSGLYQHEFTFGPDGVYMGLRELLVDPPDTRYRYARHYKQVSIRNLSAPVQNIIKACGKKPESTTQAEMDALDARLICVSCKFGPLRVMTWRSAIQHCRKHVLMCDEIQWQDVSHVRPVAMAVEAKRLAIDMKRHEGQPCWCCARCHGWNGHDQSLENIQAHYVERHSDVVQHQATVASGDIYLNPTTPFLSMPVKLDARDFKC